MWWAGEAVELYVGSDESWLAGTPEQPEAQRHTSATLAMQALHAQRKGGKPALKVWLSGDLARPFLVGPVAGLRSWNEALVFARSAALRLRPDGDACQVELEDWPGAAVALATSAPTAFIEHLGAEALRLRLRVVLIRPWWCRALEAAGADTRSAAIEDSDALTVLREDGKAWLTARTYSPRPEGDQLAQFVARIALAEDLSPDEIRVLRWNPAADLRRNDEVTVAATV